MYEMILDAIKGMDENEIVILWNEYCIADQRFDDEIMTAYELEEYAKNQDPMYLLNRFYFGCDEGRKETSANPNRNYFSFDGYGNIISFDYIYNKYADEFYNIDIDALVDYIVNNENALFCDEIQEILDNANDEEEA